MEDVEDDAAILAVRRPDVVCDSHDFESFLNLRFGRIPRTLPLAMSDSQKHGRLFGIRS